MTSALITPPTFDYFSESITAEFCQGSAIAPALFSEAITIIADVEQLPGNDVSYPIHESLGWNPPTRFGHQARPNLYAALIQDERGQVWQAKLSQPRRDDKAKVIKYETPINAGSKAYLPPVPMAIRQKIAGRIGLEPPAADQSFWDWVSTTPSIPLVITEGAKKAMALLSAGYVAIALMGVNAGYHTSRDESGAVMGRVLIDDLHPFVTPDRDITLAFDQDEKPETRKRVGAAIAQFGCLLESNGAKVRVTKWPSKYGKGIDDAIVHHGERANIFLINLFNGAENFGDRPALGYTEVVALNLYSGDDWICVAGKLHRWTGTHYEERPDELELRRISSYLRSYRTVSRGKVGYYHANGACADAALRWVKMSKAVPANLVNPTGALNLKNGVLVLDWSGHHPSWELHPHNPDKWKFTYPPLYDYNPDANPEHCDRLLAALEPGEREIFLRIIAAAIDLPEIRKRKGRIIRTALLWGDGNNGKDALREAVGYLFGAVGLTGCTFQDFQQYDQGRKFPLAVLEYSRINWSSENCSRLPLDALESLKLVISGDRLDIERKSQDSYSVVPNCICLFNLNGLPNLKANSEAIKSRYVVLSLKKTFKLNADPAKGELEADPRFKYDPQWVKDAILPALLNQVLSALQRLAIEGVDYTPTLGTIEEIQRQNCHLLQFCADTGLEYAPGEYVEVSIIWERLEKWYVENAFLDIDDSGAKVKRIWAEPPIPGDKLVKASNQIRERFLQLFGRCKPGVLPRSEGGKPIPIIRDLVFNSADNFSEIGLIGLRGLSGQPQNPDTATVSELNPVEPIGLRTEPTGLRGGETGLKPSPDKDLTLTQSPETVTQLNPITEIGLRNGKSVTASNSDGDFNPRNPRNPIFQQSSDGDATGVTNHDW